MQPTTMTDIKEMEQQIPHTPFEGDKSIDSLEDVTTAPEQSDQDDDTAKKSSN